LKVLIRESAFADLENNYNWIAEENAVSARSVVRRMLDTVENKIAHLCRTPWPKRRHADHARIALHHCVPRRIGCGDGPWRFSRCAQSLI
jgi:plasmid stabilization system protein ParE